MSARILKSLNGVRWRDLTDASLAAHIKAAHDLLVSGGVMSVSPRDGIIHQPHPAPVIMAAREGMMRERAKRAGQPRKRIKFTLMAEEAWL